MPEPSPRSTWALRIAVLGLFACVALEGSAHALDPRRAITQYVVTRWQRDSGLPGGAVLSLAQTRDGYLWLGTSTGLFRFDGVRFSSHSGQGARGLGAGVRVIEGAVSALAGTEDGALWVGTMSGVVAYQRDGRFTPLPEWPRRASVASFARREGGGLWVAGGNTLRRFSGGHLEIVARPSITGIPSVVEDRRGALWMGSRAQGLVRCLDGRYTFFTRRNGLPSDMVLSLYADSRGDLWVGTLNGLCRMRDGDVRCYRARDGLLTEAVSAITEDRDGNLWLGTQGGGLYRFRDGRFAGFTHASGLSDDDVRAVLEDREGNLWIGTANGLTRLGEGRFTTYGRAEGLRDDRVRAVVGARDGSLWLGMTTGGIARLRGDVLTHFTSAQGLGSENIVALYEARDGTVYAGSDDGRLYSIRKDAVADVTPLVPGARPKYSAFCEDAQGVIVGASGVTAGRLRGRGFIPLSPDAPRVFFFHHLYADDGGTWFATVSGLIRAYDGGYDRHSLGEIIPSGRVRWIAPDPEGGLWLATQDGLAHFHEGRGRIVTDKDGLPENYLRFVFDDGKGTLWLSATASIFRLDKRQVLARFAGSPERLSPFVYDTSDGLRTTEVLLGSNPACVAADGRLWFATAKGVAVIDPRRTGLDPSQPRTVIEDVVVDGTRDRRDKYPPGRGAVEIEYTALSLRAPHRLLFRYKLESFDKEWVVAGTRRTAYYNNLPPGKYRFTVVASNSDGVWSDEGPSMDFHLEPPFHRTPWFYALCLSLAMALALGAHRYRVAQVRARYTAVAAERERIAREWHDSLAQGIAAVGIQLQAILEKLPDPGEVKRHAELAWHMVRSSLEEVRGSIWALRSQDLERAGLVTALRQTLGHLTRDTRIGVALHVDGFASPLSPDFEWNALRIAQEAITNAVRHARAGRIDVVLGHDSGVLKLSVKDDGRGFDSETVLSPGQLHFGLMGMHERAMALGGKLHIASRPGEGTEVVAELPLRGPGKRH